jgi:hypothetical protein
MQVQSLWSTAEEMHNECDWLWTQEDQLQEFQENQPQDNQPQDNQPQDNQSGYNPQDLYQACMDLTIAEPLVCPWTVLTAPNNLGWFFNAGVQQGCNTPLTTKTWDPKEFLTEIAEIKFPSVVPDWEKQKIIEKYWPEVPYHIIHTDVKLPGGFFEFTKATSKGLCNHVQKFRTTENHWEKTVDEMMAFSATCQPSGESYCFSDQRWKWTPALWMLANLLLWKVVENESDDVSKVEYLLSKCRATPDAQREQVPVLIWALSTNQLRTVQALINAGADANCVYDGFSAMDFAAGTSVAACKLMMANNAFHVNSVNCYGQTVLAMAVAKARGIYIGRQVEVIAFLLGLGVDPSFQHSDYGNKFALQHVVGNCPCGKRNCNMELLAILMKMNFSIDMETSDGQRVHICAPAAEMLRNEMRHWVLDKQFQICAIEHKDRGFLRTFGQYPKEKLCSVCATQMSRIGFNDTRDLIQIDANDTCGKKRDLTQIDANDTRDLTQIDFNNTFGEKENTDPIRNARRDLASQRISYVAARHEVMIRPSELYLVNESVPKRGKHKK